MKYTEHEIAMAKVVLRLMLPITKFEGLTQLGQEKWIRRGRELSEALSEHL